jgi:predicted porin
MGGSAYAESTVSIYGLIDIAVSKESGQGSSVHRGYPNWLGFTGQEDLGDGLSATMNLMTRFVPNSGAAESNTFWHGESTVGLKSASLGHIRFGRALTPLWGLKYQFEPWGDSWFNGSLGQYQTTSRFITNPAGCVSDCPGFARLNKGVFYDSPTFGGFDAHVATQIEREVGAARRGFGASLNYASGPLGGMLSYERNTADATALFMGMSYDFGAAVVMGSIGQSQQTGTPNQTSMVLGTTAPFGGNNAIRAGLGRDFKTGDDKFSVGAQHFFSKRTQVYADIYREKTASNVNGVALGMRHSF